jgi:signal transduction histidine kinase
LARDRERERLRTYTHEITRAQEEERKRIARELHDDTAQGLVLLCRRLDALRWDEVTLNPGPAGWFRELRSLAQATLKSVRRFSRDLRPPILDDLGLQPALEALVGELSGRTGLAASIELSGTTRRLEPEVELALFRIAQEALRNVERHAEASRVTVGVAFWGDRARLAVADNGRGFEVPRLSETFAPAGRLGLLGMQERAELVGGVLSIWSVPGDGTRVTVEVPDVNGRQKPGEWPPALAGTP